MDAVCKGIGRGIFRAYTTSKVRIETIRFLRPDLKKFGFFVFRTNFNVMRIHIAIYIPPFQGLVSKERTGDI